MTVLATSLFGIARGVPEQLVTELTMSVQSFESLGMTLSVDSNFVLDTACSCCC